MIRRWHAVGAALILGAHLCAHFAVEAIHEAVVEVSISPLMHLTEHSVARALDGPVPGGRAGVDFHAHHRAEVR